MARENDAVLIDAMESAKRRIKRNIYLKFTFLINYLFLVRSGLEGRTNQFDHFCKVEVEELKCGDPAQFYLAQGLQFNCNKELQTRCEVSCANGEASSEFVQCTIKKGRVNWKPSSLQCRAVEGETHKKRVILRF